MMIYGVFGVNNYNSKTNYGYYTKAKDAKFRLDELRQNKNRNPSDYYLLSLPVKTKFVKEKT